MSGWETTVNTGNPDYDRQTIDTYRQQAAAAGMDLQVQPLPTGGFFVRGVPFGQAAPPPAPAYGGYAPQAAPPSQQQWQQQAAPPPSYGQPAYAAASGPTPPPATVSGGGAGAAIGDDADAAKPLSGARIAYLRKVYSLLAAAAVIAVVAGAVLMNLDVEAHRFLVNGHKVRIEVPGLVWTMIQNPGLWYASFGVLVGATFVASWTSKVPVLNVIMLFVVAALMGLEMVPSIWIAQARAGLGTSLSSDPVRDAGIMTVAVFGAVTGYAFITRKDFSYLGATLSMGVVILLCCCVFGLFLGSSIFALAIASVGALLAAGIILWITSVILRGPMDDAVGDALILLVQLRNLFMWLLEIFGSRN
jgi:modulator of FtsH protease